MEAPENVRAFANAPGMVTITWDHSGESIYWFVLEQESPYTYWVPDMDKRVWSVTGLQPNTTYRYRVCAVYDTYRVCPEDGDGYVNVTTFPPEQEPHPPPPPPEVSGQQLPRNIASFESVNFPGHLMRHRNFLGELTSVVNDLDRSDASFIVRFGLTRAQHSYSLESVNFPGHFLRHQDFRLKLHRDDGSELFRQDATFLLPAHGGLSLFTLAQFESANYPGHFIRHSNYELRLGSDDGSDSFKQDSTWRRLPPPPRNAPPGTVSFQSRNYPNHFIRHRNSLGEMTKVVSELDRVDATFVVRPALSGSPIAVSMESINYPGHFLRHQEFRLKLQPNDGTDLFRQDASFFYQSSGSEDWDHAVSLESVNFPGHFIRHSNFELWLAENDGTELFANDAVWLPTPPLSAPR